MSAEKIDVNSLSPQQLIQIVKSLESEIKFFNTSLAELKSVVASFQRSEDAVKKLNKTGEGKECLVPLTDTIFVTGKTGNTDKFLIDIGTGYYAEMTADQAVAMFQRKKAFVDKQIVTIEKELLPGKKMMYQMTMDALNKFKTAAAAQANAGTAAR